MIGFLFMMAMAAQQTVQSEDAIQIPNAIRPMIGSYMNCLNSALQKRSQGNLPELEKIDEAVLADCKPIKAQATKAADDVLRSDPAMTTEERDRYVNGSFTSVDVSFRTFIEKLKSSATSNPNNSGQ